MNRRAASAWASTSAATDGRFPVSLLTVLLGLLLHGEQLAVRARVAGADVGKDLITMFDKPGQRDLKIYDSFFRYHSHKLPRKNRSCNSIESLEYDEVDKACNWETSPYWARCRPSKPFPQPLFLLLFYVFSVFVVVVL